MRVHSNPGETVLDFFAGSGTTGEAAARNGRTFVLVDANAQAIAIMERCLGRYSAQSVSQHSSGSPKE